MEHFNRNRKNHFVYCRDSITYYKLMNPTKTKNRNILDLIAEISQPFIKRSVNVFNQSQTHACDITVEDFEKYVGYVFHFYYKP